MNKKICFFLLALSLVLIAGCNYAANENTTGSLVIQLPGASKALPSQSDAASYEVNVKNVNYGYDETKTGLPGATVSFAGLFIGIYQVSVKVFDSTGKVIFVGSIEAEVEYNTVKNFQIQLDYATGSITIGIIFPAVPGAEVFNKSLQFEMECLDLDNGEVYPFMFPIWPSEPWDIQVAYNSERTPHSVILQNQSNGVQIAYLTGITFSAMDAANLTGVVFTTDLIDMPFSSDKVILIKTDMNAVFKLGNPVESGSGLNLDYAKISD